MFLGAGGGATGTGSSAQAGATARPEASAAEHTTNFTRDLGALPFVFMTVLRSFLLCQRWKRGLRRHREPAREAGVAGRLLGVAGHREGPDQGPVGAAAGQRAHAGGQPRG